MRLSEVIALGRMVLKPKKGGRRNNKSGSGCALDMGMEAMYGGCWSDAQRVWPWLNRRVGETDHCWRDEIAFRFDHEVMTSKTLTMEQFIDWVHSVEPAEDVPSSTEAVAIEAAHAEVVTKTL